MLAKDGLLRLFDFGLGQPVKGCSKWIASSAASGLGRLDAAG